MNKDQAARLTRACEVLNEAHGYDQFSLGKQLGKLEYWLRDIIALAAELDGQPPTPADRALASCGHPADEDGECSCSSWPERAPLAALQGYGYVLPEDYLRGGAQ